MDLDKLQTPCYILNEDDLVNNIKSFDNALQSKFSKHIIGYSVKTNSLPYVLKLAKDNGCYAEVVSYNEYNLALKVGFLPQHIIYNGPMKSKETFLKAVKDGAIVNIETWREIEWLKELPKDKIYKVGIRININISEVSPADQSCENDDSRFGFSIENGDFDKALDKINGIGNVTMKGIHTHREPKTRSVNFYGNVIKHIQKAIKPYMPLLEYWDIGGGFFGPMKGKPSFEEYANKFLSSMSFLWGNITLIVEPGNAIVASSFSYITEVLDVKQHNNTIFVNTNGTRNDIDPFFHKTDYFKHVSYKNNVGKSSEFPQIIGGLSCLEYDRLFTIPKGERKLCNGDKIIYERVGAYTMSLSPLFIHFFPTVYLLKNNNISVIRKEWSEKDFIAKSTY